MVPVSSWIGVNAGPVITPVGVRAGVSNGEQVATSNLEKLADGMAVKQ